MMTMVGDPIPIHRPYPAATNQWNPHFDETNPPSPYAGSGRGFLDSLSALHRYLPSNDQSPAEEDEFDGDDEGSLVLDAFSCDHFRMYEFKVRRCARGRSHDWTECPYAHPGEKARRRDPRRFHYSGVACPDFRKGVGCKKGDACEYAHGVFECWLHPARYRTQPCKDGSGCRRRVCFFAHTPDQLRVLPFGSGTGDHSYLSSPPLSTPSDSPPMSPTSPQVVSELVATMRGLHLARARSGVSPRAMQSGSMFGSPLGVSPVRTGFNSLPCTPTAARTSSLPAMWDVGFTLEEPPMERVESGRDIRAQMYAKLCRENSIGREPVEPDVGWISELVN